MFWFTVSGPVNRLSDFFFCFLLPTCTVLVGFLRLLKKTSAVSIFFVGTPSSDEYFVLLLLLTTSTLFGRVVQARCSRKEALKFGHTRRRVSRT
jgi:hypothetical protein